MNPCRCCGLTGRGGSMVVAVFSFLHCIVTSVTIIIQEYNGNGDVSPKQFYLLECHQFILALVSILLFYGAYKRNMYLCIPWIGCTVEYIIMCIIVVSAMAVKMFEHPVVSIVVAFFLMLLMLVIPVYFLWIVIRFVGKLKKEASFYHQVGGDETENTDEEKITTTKRGSKGY